jgi:hypothetical protein
LLFKDEPIGGGTGNYRGVFVFCAKRNHAGFVPITSVVREEMDEE